MISFEGRALFKDMFGLFAELPFRFMQVIRRQGLGMECSPSLKSNPFLQEFSKIPITNIPKPSIPIVTSQFHGPFSYIISQCHSTPMVSDFLASGRCPQQNLTFSFRVRPKNVLPQRLLGWRNTTGTGTSTEVEGSLSLKARTRALGSRLWFWNPWPRKLKEIKSANIGMFLW